MASNPVIFATSSNYGRQVELRVCELDQFGDAVAVMPSAALVPCSPDEWVKPTAVMRIERAQELMDQLWSIGLRPTQGKMAIGQVEAVQAHLNDMRAIAFHKLGMKDGK